jgi:hypothetical protein
MTAPRSVPDPFGREDPPGLYVNARPLEVAEARQVTFIGVESTAMHSRSLGWLPCALLTVSHVALVNPDSAPSQTLKLMLTEEDALLLVEHVLDGMDAAKRDASYGPRET